MVNLILTSNQTPYYYESGFIFSKSRREKKIHLAPRHHFIAKCPWRSLFWKPKYSRLERYWLCRSSAGWVIPLWKERAHIITIHVFYCQMIILNYIGLQTCSPSSYTFSEHPSINKRWKKKQIRYITIWLLLLLLYISMTLGRKEKREREVRAWSLD